MGHVKLIPYYLFVIALLLTAAACKSKSKQSAAPSYNYNPGEIGITDFGGIKSIDEVTDTTAHIIWDYHPQAYVYFIYQKKLAPVAEEDYSLVAHLNADQTALTISGLSINSTYSFKMHAYDRKGRIDDNQVERTVQTNLAPTVPVSVMLKTPALSPGFMRAPTVTVRYVKSGETVKIFSDASCTQLLGQAVVGNDKTSVDVTSSSLSVGTPYEIYANTTSIYGHTSACSTAHVSYLVKTCPDDSYVAVEGNDDLGSDAFCVFRTEAKNNGADVPISAYEGTPWGKIAATYAKPLCRSIDLPGGTSDLIANIEWMTIARDIEATAANWSGGEVGSGTLNRGHSDGSPSSAISISDPTDPWNQTGNNSSTWIQKRTFILSSGEVLWDFAGNVCEWVDWEPGGANYTKGPTTCDQGEVEFYSLNCADIPPNYYLPGNPAGIDFSEYNHNCGLGLIRVTNSASEGGALRGGAYHSYEYSGIFTLGLANNTGGMYNQNGFRCVWRPD